MNLVKLKNPVKSRVLRSYWQVGYFLGKDEVTSSILVGSSIKTTENPHSFTLLRVLMYKEMANILQMIIEFAAVNAALEIARYSEEINSMQWRLDLILLGFTIFVILMFLYLRMKGLTFRK